MVPGLIIFISTTTFTSLILCCVTPFSAEQSLG